MSAKAKKSEVLS